MKTTIILSATLFLLFSNASAQENTLSETGNIGIGTTNPEAKLEVNGKVKIDSTLIVKDSVTIEKSMKVDGTTKLKDLEVSGYLNVSGPAKFGNKLKFDSIPLSEEDNFNFDLLMLDSNGFVLKSGVTSLTDAIYHDKFCPSGHEFPNPTWSNGLNKIFSRCPDVFVGIGTSTPRVNLDVLGTTYTNRLSINSNPTAMGSKLFHMKSTATGEETLFLIENENRSLFQVNNGGTVWAREVRVNLHTAWPDYVFKQDYKLKTLKEIEAFIQKHGHLPNVPSAEQVATEGISLGEMDKILLEKIEELTLHLIEQQKLIEAQQQLIEQQNARIQLIETK